MAMWEVSGRVGMEAMCPASALEPKAIPRFCHFFPTPFDPRSGSH